MKHNALSVTVLLTLALALTPSIAASEGAPPGLTGGGLDGSNATFLGENAGDYAGVSVAGAGDVNGDGYDDLLIGADHHSSNRGQAYLFLGGPGGWQLDEGLADADAIYTGESTGDYAGCSVAGVGDVNGDGYEDMLVGAFGHDGGGGRAYLVLGSGSPSDASLGNADAIYTGENPGMMDAAGASVAGAGDVNGDGYDDLLIGAYGYQGETGRAYLVLGSASPSDMGLGSAQARYTGQSPGDRAGWSVAGAGDVNGDGYADVLIGAAFYGSNTGQAYLVLGSASPSHTGLASADAIYMGESGGDRAGVSVAGAGDVNGDGYADMLVGADMYSSELGRAYLVLGGSDPATSISLANADAIYTGEADEDYAGYSAAGAGDVNGDGYADMLVGAYGYGSLHGRVYLLLGSSDPSTSITLTNAAAIYTGEDTNHIAGRSVTGAGDVNGDGYSDLLIGAEGFDGFRGKVYLVFSDYVSATAARYRGLQTDTHTPVEVGASRVTVDYGSGAPGGSVYVTRHFRSTCGTHFATSGLLWTVDSQRGVSASATFTFRYNDTQIAGWTEGDLKLYHRDRPCQEWTQDGSATLDTAHNRITSSSVTDAHREYTIAPGTPNPTALGPTGLGVSLAQEPPWTVIFLALLIILAAAAEWWRRRLGRAVP